MKKVKVEISGTSPLLIHSAQGMVQQHEKSNPAKKYDPKVDAEMAAYRNKDKNLYVPSRCVKACFVNGASWYKFGKNNAKPIIAGCTRIEGTNVPVEIELMDGKGKVVKDYVIDLRPVVVQRARILRARPRLDEWKLQFNIIYNEDRVDVDVLRKILVESGERIGLLDNRPQKYGENGCFEVTKWVKEK